MSPAPLVFFPSLLKLTGQQQDERPVVMRLCTFRIDANRPFKGGTCISKSAKFHQRGAQVVVGFDIVRAESYSLLASGDSLLKSSLPVEEDSQIIAEFG